VSAPSTLAIDLALECGMTLVGFVRGDSFNVYAHPERVAM
jgi:FdhD protein